MATYRQVHVHMWKDPWFLDLRPPWKLLFVYLLSNERAHLSGVYELPFRAMLFESGLRAKQVREALAYFEASGKVWYDEEKGQVFVRNLMRHNAPNAMSARILAHLRKHRVSAGRVQYWAMWEEVYPKVAGRLSMPCIQEQDKEQEQQQEQAGRGAPGGSGGGRGMDAVVKTLELAGQEAVNALDRQRIKEMMGAAEAHRLSLDRGVAGAGRAGSEWVCEAVRVANGARKRGSPVSLNFVESVLRRWMEEGFRARWGGGEAVQFVDVEYWVD